MCRVLFVAVGGSVGNTKGRQRPLGFLTAGKINPRSLTDEVAEHDLFGLLQYQFGAVPTS